MVGTMVVMCKVFVGGGVTLLMDCIVFIYEVLLCAICVVWCVLGAWWWMDS